MRLSLRYPSILFLGLLVNLTVVGSTPVALSAEPSLLTPRDDESEGFVAVGELQRIRRDDGTRRMALLDNSGSISAFVAPSARINLRQYVGQTVAVTAKSVSRNNGKAPSIMPERVTPLTARTATKSHVPDDSPVGTGVRQASFETTANASRNSPVRSAQPVEQASYESWEVLGDSGTVLDGGIVNGDVIDGGIVDGGMIDSGIVTGGCTSGACGSCSTCVGSPCGGCGLRCGGGCGGSVCGPWGRIFVRAEYLAWWTSGMDIPALVTGSDPDTSRGNAGVRGLDSTNILYGEEDVITGLRSGARIKFGGFLGPCRRLGWEIEYLTLGDEREFFEARSDGNGDPIIARPFFNMNPRVNGSGALDPPPGEDAEIVAYPGLLSGVANVESESSLHGAGARLRWNFCCKKLACGGCCGCGPPRGFSKVDLTAGYRYLALDDRIAITEDLTSLQSFNPGRFQISDQFETENRFHGAELGFLWEGGWRNVTLEAYSRIALGNVNQRVRINGNTTISPLTQPQQEFSGGLLAQRSNIGEYEQDEFGIMNELGLTLGLYLTPRLRATVGYTFLFLSPVARAGDQIDLDLNPDLLPPEIDPFTGPERPQFAFQETDFWANGLNVGLDLRF